MIETNDGYKFECSNREILTHGTDGISITIDEEVIIGYDCLVEMWDDTKEEYHSNFTDDQKKELALFMIAKWSNFGGLLAQQLTIKVLPKLGILEHKSSNFAPMLNR